MNTDGGRDAGDELLIPSAAILIDAAFGLVIKWLFFLLGRHFMKGE